jgi:hypothetical protein
LFISLSLKCDFVTVYLLFDGVLLMNLVPFVGYLNQTAAYAILEQNKARHPSSAALEELAVRGGDSLFLFSLCEEPKPDSTQARSNLDRTFFLERNSRWIGGLFYP